MKLSNITKEEIGTLRARDLIEEFNTHMNKSTSAISQMLADTADRALARGDIQAARFFFNMAAKS